MKSFFSSFLFAFGLAFAALSNAASPIPYTQDGFDALQKAGKPTLVHIHAKWCSTCRAQSPIVDNLLNQKEYQSITGLHVDYDSQKDIVKALGANKQSTLIVFKGGKEVARSLGDTSPSGIESLIEKAL